MKKIIKTIAFENKKILSLRKESPVAIFLNDSEGQDLAENIDVFAQHVLIFSKWPWSILST